MNTPDLVPRRTLVIADLHGAHRALQGNLLGADAIDAQGNWKHPNTDLVFLGDVLADRSTDDFQVVASINRLREQVRAAGGSCTSIMGNHEAEGHRFLTKDPRGYSCKVVLKKGDPDDKAERIYKQYAGLKVLSGAVSAMRQHSSRTLEELRQQREDLIPPTGKDPFLGRFKMSDRGREVMQYFVNLELYAIHGSSLFVHTPPTKEMLRIIIDDEGTLNPLFRKRIALSWRQKNAQRITEKETQRVNEAYGLFVNPDNRKEKVPDGKDLIWDELKDKGVSKVFFGHDADSHGFWPTHETVELFGLDSPYGRNTAKTLCAAAWLHPDHTVEGFRWTL